MIKGGLKIMLKGGNKMQVLSSTESLFAEYITFCRK